MNLLKLGFIILALLVGVCVIKLEKARKKKNEVRSDDYYWLDGTKTERFMIRGGCWWKNASAGVFHASSSEGHVESGLYREEFTLEGEQTDEQKRRKGPVKSESEV